MGMATACRWLAEARGLGHPLIGGRGFGYLLYEAFVKEGEEESEAR